MKKKKKKKNRKVERDENKIKSIIHNSDNDYLFVKVCSICKRTHYFTKFQVCNTAKVYY